MGWKCKANYYLEGETDDFATARTFSEGIILILRSAERITLCCFDCF